MFPTFEPPLPPSPGTDLKPKLSLNRAEFGDGYTQTSRRGLNHIRDTVSLSWDTLTPCQSDEIDAFLRERGGDLPFYYTLSDAAAPTLWTCGEWSVKRGKVGFRALTATFEQSFILDN